MRVGETALSVPMEDVPLHLGALRNGMLGLSPDSGGVLAEAAAVCLEDQNHTARTLLRGTGLMDENRFVEWIPTDEQCRRSHADMQEATERGACGIAILIAHEFTGKIVVQRSKKGTGFDYWLGEPQVPDDTLPFSTELTRLEVSGILSGTGTQVAARVKQKKSKWIQAIT